jgi:putative heme iron utilization protein
MTAAMDLETRRLLRVLGETALRLADGDRIDTVWRQ